MLVLLRYHRQARPFFCPPDERGKHTRISRTKRKRAPRNSAEGTAVPEQNLKYKHYAGKYTEATAVNSLYALRALLAEAYAGSSPELRRCWCHARVVHTQKVSMNTEPRRNINVRQGGLEHSLLNPTQHNNSTPINKLTCTEQQTSPLDSLNTDSQHARQPCAQKKMLTTARPSPTMKLITNAPFRPHPL